MLESLIIFSIRIAVLILICLLSYNIGIYKAYTKIYEALLKEYTKTHLKENFQEDVNNKIKES